MIPTPEMIEAACVAHYGEEFANWTDDGKSSTRRIVGNLLTAALALLPGEPIGYRYKLRNDTRWEFTRYERTDVVVCEPVYAAAPPQGRPVAWTQASELETIADGGSGQIWAKRNIAAYRAATEDFTCPDDVPLYLSSPAPMPVAVKELIWSHRNEKPQYDISADCPFGRYHIANRGDAGFGWLRPRSTVFEGFEPSLSSAKAAAQADYEARIRSALSSPVGGMEESTAIIERCAAIADDAAKDFERQANLEENAMRHDALFLVADGCELVAEAIRELKASSASPTPTPASDIAALREENERLRKALEKIASVPAWGYPERWETTPAEVRQLARSVINESKKGAEQ